MISNPFTGAGYFMKGLSLINKPGIRRFVIIPLLINTVLFIGLFTLLGSYFNDLVDQMVAYLPGWLSWLSWLFWLLFVVTAAMLMFMTFSLLANLIGAPFNSYLAAAVEKHLTGHEPPESPRNLWQEIGVAVLSELKKWVYYLLWLIPLVIASIVLVPLAPVLWFLFGAWMYSIEYSDYPLGNYGLTFPQIRRKVAEQRFLSMGFGSAVTLATMIPVFNFLVMPVAVAGATALRVEQMPMDRLPEHNSGKREKLAHEDSR